MPPTIRLLLVVVLAGACGLAGYLVGRPGVRAYEQRKLGLIASVTRQAGPGQLLIVGDSIVDMQPLPRMCGLTTLNAGIAGAQARDVRGITTRAVAIAAPSRVVYAIGINDIAHDPGFDLDRWTGTMRALVATWAGKPILVGITRLPGAHTTMTGRMNSVLQRLAVERGGLFVPGLAPGETYDGVHPTLAGAAAWQARVAAACNRLNRP